ncbi:RICIN domain-containing protein [Actinospica sp.]|uniref:RICIN domain-containing protein n=1 Tax=Actinospica sp. TaxID=1872142 RepID=UPI002C0B69DC|nr:RICIN domain-containing protein [Actinospica sp.]HWG24655.1 RICIN domain-containing protein [Actinospica sp.]
MRRRTHPQDGRKVRGVARLGLIAATAAAVAAAGLTAVVLSSSTALAAAPSESAYQAPDTPSPSVAGATTPFATYQAPEGQLGGGASVVSLTAAPTSQYDSPQGEASGHAYVQLTGNGQSVQWTNETGQPISFVNVRASIPDSSSGGGQTATLDLYVNGTFRQALAMNSLQSWQYEGNNNYNGSDQNPADGSPRNFWDEFHASISGAAIPAGATFSLQKDSANSSSFYWINSIDLWNAPAPAAQPANSISITSCGATADNTPTNGSAAAGATDSTADIQNCISQAESQNKILWIPQGTFYVIGTNSLPVSNITVEGAGYLYSEIYRDVPLPNSSPLGSLFQCTSCHLQDLHIDSNSQSRATVDGGGGAEDTTGDNWSIEDMWVQHVESSVWASGSGGVVENNFFTSIWADGCNLNNVSLTGTSGSNLTATNNFIRGTGDDGMAINSVAYNGSTTYTAMTNITMSHNTVIAAWGGKGIGVYGGSGHHVQNNYLADTARYIGLGVGRFGVNGSDMTGATVSGNVVVRSGGNAYNQGQPALHVGNGGDGQNTGTVSNAVVTDNTVIQSVYDGIAFSTSTGTTLSDNQVINPWRNGVVISPPYYPAPSGSATLTGNSVTGLGSGFTAFANDSSGFTATTSDNSWQNSTSEGAYGGSAAAVPGTVQAENYDTGGQGIGYNVNSVNGTGNSYRSDGVDLEATSDTGGGDDVGWNSQGQWLRYTVDVATAGTYTLGFRVAAPSAVTDALHVTDSSGTDLSGAVDVAATGGWQTWATVTASVNLPAGRQTLVVDEDNGGWNFNYLTFTAAGGNPTSTPTTSPTPTTSSSPTPTGTSSPTPTPTSTSGSGSTINSSAWYEVVNENSGSCADDANFGTANGAILQQWSCGGANNQQWQLAPTSSGYYSVLSRETTSANLVWDVTGGTGATSPGTGVQLWSNGGGTNQQWEPVATSGGYYTFQARNSGLCLTVPNSSTANGVQLTVDTCNGTSNQAFRLVQEA